MLVIIFNCQSPHSRSECLKEVIEHRGGITVDVNEQEMLCIH